ncbi:hypothetical protein SAMN05216337_105149 [Bradyrhizobium brasilense]|uniref:Uncharacterized protein n=1 Tax=Bradyrhizobium brasilense TaxID=1419277 RepID=A0A1G7K5Z4_9BRAD|nr:hypothetical protein [Bradyrhizobium brasilense]SDF32643.1 hypothetical protein SAMN05216337_105149 [Bradyrhizobium brasilense]
MAAAKWQPARDFGDRHTMRDGVGAACAVAALVVTIVVAKPPLCG